MSGYARAHLSDIEPLEPPGGEAVDWRPVRHQFGIEAFGVNAWIGHHAGDEVIEEHDELPTPDDGTAGHEELYFVSSGTARFRVGEDEFDAVAGTFVAVRDPAVVRHALAAEDGTTVLAIGAAPGVAFSPSQWELRQVERAGAA